MQIVSNRKLADVIRQAQIATRLFRDIGQDKLADDLASLVGNVREQRFVIGVIGSAKRGKSTLINGLLGRSDDDCAPIGKLPATNVISLFAHAPELGTKVYFGDGTTKDILIPEIRLYVTEKMNPENEKNVRSVEVAGPFLGLEKGVCIVDTPGADNALAALHGQILTEFLPVADAVIFMVTVEEPLTASEQNLLKSIRGNDTKKILFAVNKVDRVESGDVEPEELSQGIEHNRKILNEVGFPDAKIFAISARRYLEKKSDPGLESLLSAMRNLIENERIGLMVDRLRDRTQSFIRHAHSEMTLVLQESRATVEQLEKERQSLIKTREELRRNQASRQRRFSEQWTEAFDDLEVDVQKIRNELIDEYSRAIDGMKSFRAQSLGGTIHADVQVSFAERFRTKMGTCERKINEATSNLKTSVEHSVHTALASFAPAIPVGKTPTDMIKEGFKIGASATPALVTGIVSANLPGMVASLISSATPAVSSVGLNPLTWLPHLFTAGTATVLGGTGAVVTTALSAIATPFAIGAFALSAYRAYSTWQANRDMQKNELKSNVIRMVEEGYTQIREQIASYRRISGKILADFEESIESSIEQADRRLAELIANRPAPAQIQRNEEIVKQIEQQIRLLEAPRSSEPEGFSTPSSGNDKPILDDILSR